MANGNGNGNGAQGLWADMPWWVKAIALVGVPSIISIGVIMSDRMQLAGEVHSNADKLNRIESMTTLHDSRVWVRFEELSQATKETNRILLATCINEANKSETTQGAATARDRCFGR